MDATTAEVRDGAAAVPASVSGVGWTWEAPEGESVRSAVAAGAGAVVLLEGGVVALDGETGTELWHHRRKGARTASMFNASADGELVMVDFVSGATERPGRSLLTVLDARTGQVRALSPWYPSESPRLVSRESGLFVGGLVENNIGRSVIGYDPGTLRKKWEYLPSENCRPRDGFSFTAALDVVVTAHDCAPGRDEVVSPSREGDGSPTYPAEVVALDPADGSVVWSRALTTSRTAADIYDNYGEPRVEAGADGAVVHVSWSTSGEEMVQQALVLDQADGSVLAEGIEGGWLPYASRDTDFPQPWNGFTAQGYLEDERGDGEVRYTWNPFSGGDPGADLRMEQLGNDDVPGHPNGGLALDDMLLSTQWLYAPDWEELQAERGGSWFDVGGVRSVVVQGASWDGTQEWELVVAVPVLSEDGITWPNRAQGLIPPDVLFNDCLAYTPAISTFNFNSMGRWLEGSDFSNGWPFGFYSATLYNHVAPPNWQGFDCGNWSAIIDAPGEHGIVSARSMHMGGANVQLGDTAVVAVEEGEEVLRQVALVVGAERADDAEVHRQPARPRRVAGIDEDVAGVHVGMEETMMEDLREEDLDPGAREGRDVDSFVPEDLHLRDRRAVHPLHHHHALRAKVPVDRGYDKERRRRKITSELARVRGLAHEVELIVDMARKLGHHVPGAQALAVGPEALHQRGTGLQKGEVTLHGGLDAGSQHLYRNFGAAVQPRQVHLRDRGARNRALFKPSEHLVKLPAQRSFHLGHREPGRERRHLVLEPCKLVGDVDRNEVPSS